MLGFVWNRWEEVMGKGEGRVLCCGGEGEEREGEGRVQVKYDGVENDR